MKLSKIILLTTNIESVNHFYHTILKLPIIQHQAGYISFKIGDSILAFQHSTEFEEPIYHYAFNIPENQFQAAKRWLQSKVQLITQNGKDEFDFVNWNAHSIYFYDSVGNIGELIARHNLNNQSNQPFSDQSLLSISEIGLPSKNLPIFAQTLQEQLQLNIFSASSAQFKPLGNDEGLFIIVPEHRIWYLTDIPAGIFPIDIEIDMSYEINFQLEAYNFRTKKLI